MVPRRHGVFFFAPTTRVLDIVVFRYLDEAPQRAPLAVLFVGFVLFLSIVLVNLFIGVVTDVYPTAKDSSERVRLPMAKRSCSLPTASLTIRAVWLSGCGVVQWR